MSDRVSKTKARACRGGAPVGYLEEFGELEASAILYMRLWCAGPEARRRVCEDFLALLGPKRGEIAFMRLGSLLRRLHEFGRRPLIRHHETCRCVGGDEAAFANMVAAAASQDREDAALLATNFMRADMAMLVVAEAEEFGMSLKQLGIAISRANAIAAAPFGAAARTLH